MAEPDVGDPFLEEGAGSRSQPTIRMNHLWWAHWAVGCLALFLGAAAFFDLSGMPIGAMRHVDWWTAIVTAVVGCDIAVVTIAERFTHVSDKLSATHWTPFRMMHCTVILFHGTLLAWLVVFSTRHSDVMSEFGDRHDTDITANTAIAYVAAQWNVMMAFALIACAMTVREAYRAHLQHMMPSVKALALYEIAKMRDGRKGGTATNGARRRGGATYGRRDDTW